MASLASTPTSVLEEESISDLSNAGPIGALLIAVPISLVLWGIVVWALLNLIH